MVISRQSFIKVIYAAIDSFRHKKNQQRRFAGNAIRKRLHYSHFKISFPNTGGYYVSILALSLKVPWLLLATCIALGKLSRRKIFNFT